MTQSNDEFSQQQIIYNSPHTTHVCDAMLSGINYAWIAIKSAIKLFIIVFFFFISHSSLFNLHFHDYEERDLRIKLKCVSIDK